MLPDPVTLSLNNAGTITVTYNVVESGSRKTSRRGSITGTIPNVATHSPIATAEVSHQVTKASRERSLLKLSLASTHASTGVKESASVSLVIDSEPNGALRSDLIQALLIQLTNLLNEGFAESKIDIGSVSISTELGQFINGEA
jgi:hypothetical protein